MKNYIKRKFREYAKENEYFLAQNAKNEDVKVLPSGIQYRVIEQGTGVKPTIQSIVQVFYTGKMIDGTEFDSNLNDGIATAFRLRDVIEGWQIAIPEMQVGSTWEIFIPQEYAYGGDQVGNIKRYSALIFTIKLVNIA